MAKLIYSAIASLDGYIEDERGKFDWAHPGEDLHAYINEVMREVGTHLYGRRMYETMVAWETMSTEDDQPPVARDFARVWQAAEKIVYSRTLARATSARTRIERVFDADAVRELKHRARHDLMVGGAEISGEAIRAGLVDECHLYLMPVLVGGGKPMLPSGVRAQLELLKVGRFDGGVVELRYRITR